MPTVIEYICRVNGHPKYSGSLEGAKARAARAHFEAAATGGPDPEIKIIERTVIYGGETIDSNTGELTVGADRVFEKPVEV